MSSRNFSRNRSYKTIKTWEKEQPPDLKEMIKTKEHYIYDKYRPHNHFHNNCSYPLTEDDYERMKPKDYAILHVFVKHYMKEDYYTFNGDGLELVDIFPGGFNDGDHESKTHGINVRCHDKVEYWGITRRPECKMYAVCCGKSGTWKAYLAKEIGPVFNTCADLDEIRGNSRWARNMKFIDDAGNHARTFHISMFKHLTIKEFEKSIKKY